MAPKTRWHQSDMLDEIDLDDSERRRIYDACARAIERTERFRDDAIPREGVVYQIMGQKGLLPFAIGWGVASGIVGYTIWSALLQWIGATIFLSDLGAPHWLAANIPVALAVWAAAMGTAVPLVGESREARHRLMTEQQNAEARAAVLFSVIEELRDAMPGAIPEMDDYCHSHDDDRPSPLVERALGRRGPPDRRRSVARREPPVSGR